MSWSFFTNVVAALPYAATRTQAQEKNYQFAKKELEAVQAKRLQEQLEAERRK